MKKPLHRPRLDFEVFLTNRCNLACSYCSSRHLRAEREARSLSFGQLKKFIDLVTGPAVRRKFPGTVKVLFSGGEPLLEYPALKRLTDYVRARRLDVKLSVMTNGTLLTPARLRCLTDRDVNIGISLDGIRTVNDLHRRFAGGPGRSVFLAVLRGLGKGFPTARQLRRCRMMATLTPRTIGDLTGTVDFFRRGLGVKRLSVELEAYDPWTRADSERLRLALRRYISRSLAGLRPGAPAWRAEEAFAEFPLLQNKHYRDDSEDPAESLALTLLYDGRFYPSPDMAVGPAATAEKYQVGDLDSGIDFSRLRALLAPVQAELERKCGPQPGPRSPFEGYAWGLANGFSRARLDRLLASTCRLNSVFEEETAAYLRQFRIYRGLQTTPGFGDFTHRPRYAAGKPASNFTLRAGPRPDLPRLRRSLDFFLYAPGREKSLRLEADGASAEAAAALRGMALYALMKARRLGLRLKLRLAPGGRP